MSDEDQVRAANAAFYAAFRAGDGEQMAALWAEARPVMCIHPGRAAASGRAAVLAGWQEVLESPPDVREEDVSVQWQAAVAVVLCRERIGPAALQAVNLFAREAGRWKLVGHQATPIAAGAPGQPKVQRTLH